MGDAKVSESIKIQDLRDGRIDMQTVSVFANADENTEVPRRLAPPVKSMSYYTARLDEAKNNADSFVAGIPQTVNNAINNTAVDGGVIADTFVTMTAKGNGTIPRNLREVNSDSISVKDFGAISDGTYHPVSDWTLAGSRIYFPNLEAIQEAYPHVIALTDSIDWCAAQAFLNSCHANFHSGADMTMNGVITRPLHFAGVEHATQVITGDVHLRAIAGFPLDYFVKWEGKYSNFIGNFRFYGFKADANVNSSKTCKNGLLLGTDDDALSSTVSALGAKINSIQGRDLSGYPLVIGQSAHFAKVGYVHSTRNGSAPYNATASNALCDSAAWSNKTDLDAGKFTGSSSITVDKMPQEQVAFLEKYGDLSNSYAIINGEVYTITAVDRTANTVTVKPEITTTATSGTLQYVTGGAYYGFGNNTANVVIERVNSILSGVTLRLATLYGVQFTAVTSEFCGIDIAVGGRGQIHMGSTIACAYFENSAFNIVESWTQTFSGLKIYNSMGSLSASKITSLYTYLSPSRVRVNDSSYGKITSSFQILEKSYSPRVKAAAHDITDIKDFTSITGDSSTITLSCSEILYKLYGKGSTTLNFVGVDKSGGGNPTGTITINAGTGQTINGASSFKVRGANYDRPVSVTFSRSAENTIVAHINTRKSVSSMSETVYELPSIAAYSQHIATISTADAVSGDKYAVGTNLTIDGVRVWINSVSTGSVSVLFKNDNATATAATSIKVALRKL